MADDTDDTDDTDDNGGVPQLDRTHREVYKPLVRAAVASREASTAAGLPEVMLELINVRVSQINGCASCLAQHVPQARKAGITQSRLDLLPAWRNLDEFGGPEKAALRLAETLTTLDDAEERMAATVAAAEYFNDEQLSALEWTIVLINSFNRVSIASHHQPQIKD